MRIYYHNIKHQLPFFTILFSDYEPCGFSDYVHDDNDFSFGRSASITSHHKWPWMGSIGRWTDGMNKWEHRCGATLITNEHALSAAHCVDRSDPTYNNHR